MRALKGQADPEFLSVLISHGARLDGIDQRGNTVYHYAAKNSLAVLNLLLKVYPLPLFNRNSDGETPLMISERIGHRMASKMLAPLEMRSACLNGDLATVQSMMRDFSIDINAKLPGGRTCFYYALTSSHQAILDFLVQRGVRDDLGDIEDTPLRWPFEFSPQPPNPVMTARAPELARRKRGFLSPTTLVLHYNPFTWDSRPRATMSLSKNDKIGYSCFLDTGSVHTFLSEYEGTPEEKKAIAFAPPSYKSIDGIDHSMEPVTRAAKYSEGYRRVSGLQQTGPTHTMNFGTAGHSLSIVSNGRFQEVAHLYSGQESFIFDVEIALAKRLTLHPSLTCLLGAGRRSHLAISAGIFSYLGPSVRYTGPSTRSAGTLIIGKQDESILKSNCLEGQDLRFFSTQTGISQIHWVVEGSVTMNNEFGAAIMTSDNNWVIDTGAKTQTVPTEMLAAIKEAMWRNGAEVISEKRGRKSIYSNCPDPARMPSFTFYLGSGSQAVPVVISPEDYIGARSEEGGCTLFLIDEPIARSMRLLGMPVLSKLLTVFDSENDRVGFCVSRL
jgi:hypothetical protein